MDFIMDISEQVFLLSDGAMGFHCNGEKEKKMPFMCFKKNIELNLNNFLLFLKKGAADRPLPLCVLASISYEVV